MHRLRCSDGWTKWAFIDGYPIGHDLRLRCVIQSGRTRVRSPSIEFPLQTKLEKTRNKSAVFRPHPSPTALMSQPWTTPCDRKSVVEGTSVSVRVDLGGRRSIKNKKTKTNNKKR